MLRKAMNSTLVTLVFAMVVGCNTSEKATSSTACSATPPSNIDIVLCRNITGGSDATKVTECATCCTTGGYALSSFAYNDHCTCGSLDHDAGATACAAKISNSDACLSCCTGAGYQNYQYVGDASCGCDIKGNSSICAETLGQAYPAEACSCCCLGKGYISSTYVGIGTPLCECIGE